MEELIVVAFEELGGGDEAEASAFNKEFHRRRKAPRQKNGHEGEMCGRYGCLIKRDVQAFSHLREKEGDKGKLLARSGILTSQLKSQPPIGLFTGQPIRSWLLRFNTYS